MIYEDALIAARRYVADAFRAGTATFPHFTLHGAEHLDELDRLARLVGDAIPNLPEDRLNLLRLAIILHDFAMIDVPDPARETDLRQQMKIDLSFSELVRKTHQNEIEISFSKPERIAFLQSLFSISGTHLLDDAIVIAKHHRFHPLAEAPEHLVDLCALMRIIDELDIGPKRAPLPAYEALRPRMDAISRYHWLKHICTRSIEPYSTFSLEERLRRRVLKILIAVKATESTWLLIQGQVISKLNECLEKEGVNEVLRRTLNAEISISASGPGLSGPTPFLHPTVREDLDQLSKSQLHAVPASALSSHPSLSPDILHTVGVLSPPRPVREFKIVCIPPELLPETLCIAGRLTVIGNEYIQPVEDTVAGSHGSPNRIYVGPADSGKTRAALEWINRLTKDTASQWVVLRTGMGTLPENADNIVLDTSHYEDRGFLLPQKSILFLDDLPVNLPSATDSVSASAATRTLFRWYQEQSYFHVRRLTGTIRLEDMHARPGWPDVLPALGQPLELVRLKPLDKESYRALWNGMSQGSISRSSSDGISPFTLQLDQEFIESVVSRPADPEAVAVFIQRSVMNNREALKEGDAKAFSTTALETWLGETWPIFERTYGIEAKVFLALARMFEAGMRPNSGFLFSIIGPSWEAHAAFGSEICLLHGSHKDYTSILRSLILDGNAAGVEGDWIRPKFDFLLQAHSLREAELELPSSDWFMERASRLSPRARFALSFQFGARELREASYEDSEISAGLGTALLMRSAIEPEIGRRLDISRKAERTFRAAIRLNPKEMQFWYGLAASLNLIAGASQDQELKSQLFEEEVYTLRTATEIDPDNFQAWLILGSRFGERADKEAEPRRKKELNAKAIEALRKAAELNPNKSETWFNLGLTLGRQAEVESEPLHTKRLRDLEIEAYLKATEVDPQNSPAWNNLAVRLSERAEAEHVDNRSNEQLEQAIGRYRRATESDPKNSIAWHNLGAALRERADTESEPGLRREFREQEIASIRKAIELDPGNAHYWEDLSGALLKKGHESQDTQHWNEALQAGRKAVSLAGKHYHLACALALTGHVDEGLTELRGCLERGEISREHVLSDPDWAHLRAEQHFAEIVSMPGYTSRASS